MERHNNYDIQVMQAKKHFLTYDQQELIRRCRLKNDSQYFYIWFLSQAYRINRQSGDMERFCRDSWVDGNSFGEVMTVLDWLCDSREDRFTTGRWVNISSLGHSFHTGLQESGTDSLAAVFDRDPEGFSRACISLGGEQTAGADRAYILELLDGLCVLVQLWHGDEEFPPRLCCLWDENTTRYIRYETVWYAMGLLKQRLRESM